MSAKSIPYPTAVSHGRLSAHGAPGPAGGGGGWSTLSEEEFNRLFGLLTTPRVPVPGRPPIAPPRTPAPPPTPMPRTPTFVRSQMRGLRGIGANPPVTTTTVPIDPNALIAPIASGIGTTVLIGAGALVAGLLLAYVVTRPAKPAHEIAREMRQNPLPRRSYRRSRS